MKVKVNGKEETLEPARMSVEELLRLSKVERPEMVSVQLNGRFVAAADLATTFVQEGDEVDYLYYMGGGR